MITRDELAKEFKVHFNTILKWQKQGMPFYKIGGTVRYELDEVIEWFKNNNKE